MQKLPVAAVEYWGESVARRIPEGILARYRRLEVRRLEAGAAAPSGAKGAGRTSGVLRDPAPVTDAAGKLVELIGKFAETLAPGVDDETWLDRALAYAPDRHPGAMIVFALFSLLPGKVPKAVSSLTPMIAKAIRVLRDKGITDLWSSAARSVAGWIDVAMAWFASRRAIAA